MKLRTRLFFGMSILVLGIAVLTWALSFFFLEPFYLSRKQNELKEIAEEIGPLPSSPEELYGKFGALERSTTVHITIVDAEDRILYDSSAPNLALRDDSSAPGPPRMGMGRPPPFVPSGPGRGMGGRSSRIPRFPEPEAEEGTAIFETVDPYLAERLLFLTQRQASGVLLALSFPLAQIKESARIANLFLGISCILALAAGALFSYAYARSVTRPFMELIGISKSLASLDFSRRFESKRQDEVAELGETMNDLSDSLAQALEALRATNEKLRLDVEREKRVDAMRREFISSVSHELKTPIALILGYAEGLSEHVPKDEEERQAYLEVIIDEAHKMDMQVKDLLELSQLDSGTTPLRLSSFDLAVLAEEALASFEYVLKERGVSPSLKLVKTLVYADREKLRRAIVNYLTNALSHLDEARRLEVEVYPEDGRAHLSVFNSGSWISEEAFKLIWNSYYKTDSARSRQFGGTGLGLAIVRGIVERHGGSCAVENLPDAGDRPAGVRFSWTIPLTSSGPAVRRPRAVES